LALGGNPIKTVEEIKVLSKLRELKEVDFIQCPVSELPDYREKVYEIIDGLDILDNCDREGNQVADDEDVIIFYIKDEDDDDEGEDDDDDEEEDGFFLFIQNMKKKMRMMRMKILKNNVFYFYFRALKKFKKMIL